MSENNYEIKNEIKKSNISNIDINNNDNKSIRINNSIFVSQIQPDNLILFQLIAFPLLVLLI